MKVVALTSLDDRIRIKRAAILNCDARRCTGGDTGESKVEHRTIFYPGVLDLIEVYRIPGMIFIGISGCLDINTQILDADMR